MINLIHGLNSHQHIKVNQNRNKKFWHVVPQPSSFIIIIFFNYYNEFFGDFIELTKI